MKRILGLSLLGLVLTGCTNLFGDGGQSGEELIRCGSVASAPLADDEASALGFSKADIAALVDGDHDAVLAWEAGGTTPLALSVTLGAASFEDMEWIDDNTGDLAEQAMELGCADVVQIEAAVTFATDDGAFDESWDTSVSAALADSASFWVDLNLAALGGTFVMPDADAYETVDAFVNGTFDNTGAHGEISGQGTQTEGDGPDGTASATSLPVATW